MEKTYLFSKELKIINNKTIIWTVLGSCVAIIFYHKSSKTCGCSHAFLPTKGEEDKDEFKYTDSSFDYLVNEFKKKNIDLKELDIYLFGGNYTAKKDSFKIGSKNIEVLKKKLKEYNLKAKVTELGSSKGQTICFNTDTADFEVIDHK